MICDVRAMQCFLPAFFAFTVFSNDRNTPTFYIVCCQDVSQLIIVIKFDILIIPPISVSWLVLPAGLTNTVGRSFDFYGGQQCDSKVVFLR